MIVHKGDWVKVVKITDSHLQDKKKENISKQNPEVHLKKHATKPMGFTVEIKNGFLFRNLLK